MACFSPLRAWQSDAGEILFAERGKIARELVLPCGQCIGCRLERSRQWAMRCMHESQLHDFNSFVTLTYDDDHLPENGCLVYRDFQLFMKRLRKTGRKARFYMCGEYGEQRWRPHFHACLFGVFFGDRRLFKTLSSGCDIYTSEELSRLWPQGFASVGDVTFESAAYVARYVLKKITGPAAVEHYSRVNLDTGEVFSLPPEFTHMSLKPGIGFDWFQKFRSDVFENDYVIVRGVKCKPPRFYDRCLTVLDPDSKDFIDLLRYRRSFSTEVDNTNERLRAREVCTRARISRSVRSLE